jgi:hypothetical protein
MAAMEQDVLDAIVDSVGRGGRSLDDNPKLAFMLKRAQGMGIAASRIEAACGATLPGTAPAPSDPELAAAPEHTPVCGGAWARVAIGRV